MVYSINLCASALELLALVSILGFSAAAAIAGGAYAAKKMDKEGKYFSLNAEALAFALSSFLFLVCLASVVLYAVIPYAMNNLVNGNPFEPYQHCFENPGQSYYCDAQGCHAFI